MSDLTNLIPEFELDIILDNTSKDDDTNKFPTDTNPVSQNDADLDVEKQHIEKDPKAVAFFEELAERGYVSETYEFNGTWESIDNYLNTLPQMVLNSVVETFPDVSKDVMRFIAAAGENITKDELKTFFNTYFQDDAVDDITTMDDARNYLKEIYIKAGMKERAVERALDALEDDEILLETAKEEFEKNKTNSKTEALIEAKNQENQERENALKERVQIINDELNKTGWKQSRITAVKEVLSGNNFSTILQEIVKTPNALVQLADLLTYYDVKNKKFNIDDLKSKGESNAAKTLREKLEKDTFSSASVNTKHNNAGNKDGVLNLVPII